MIPRAGTILGRGGAVGAGAVTLYVALTTLTALASARQSAPFQDQWSFIGEYAAVVENGLSFEWLWRQHNEHRILLPRLVFLADLSWARGSNLLNHAVILALQASGAALLAVLAFTGRRSALTGAALAIAVAALFSLVQWENFVWGFQVQFVGVYVVGAWALYAFGRALATDVAGPWSWWSLAMALLAACAFSMANGILVGVAMIVLALAARAPHRLLLATVAVAALLAAAYFHGFEPVKGHSEPGLALRHPAAFLHYVFAYLGGLPGSPFPSRATAAGIVGAALTLAMSWRVIARGERDVAQLALFGIVLFIGLSAAATALGRLSFGHQQAISSRYATPSAWFWAAQLLFWCRHAQMLGQGARLAAWAVVALAALSIVRLQAPMRVAVEDWSARVGVGADALVLGVADPSTTAALFPNADVLHVWADVLRARKLSIFGEDAAGWPGRPLEQVFEVSPSAACQGAFDALEPVEAGAGEGAKAAGWAWDVAAGARPRRIVLTGLGGRIVGLGAAGVPRADVPAAVAAVTTPSVGWQAVAAPAPGELRAYAVLRDGRACLLGAKAPS
jgi:hypothetical protein